ncbi:MAG: hypothetical protein C0601_04105 [Candidatus Muiribacterium halophilum]|uniref:Clostripain family protease n=1 Tax=Muiribacterium halophilum TaxID=2053465 RepID=A0A2N5ZJ89_MUIH1|nr:MAG: hypothetical protein C0601_04105 [Candidatus Muirbacterium halophilum]
MKKKLLALSIMAILIFVFTGCNPLGKYIKKDMKVSEEEKSHKPWTVMVYVAADINKDLAELLIEEVKSVLAVGSGKNVHIVTQIDFPGKKKTAERYYVYKDVLARRAELEKVNMGDPATLESFLNWGMSYKADKYALLIMGKGTGWISMDQFQNKRSFAYSDSDNDSISMQEMKSVFSRVLRGKKFDTIAFNSGFMNQIEVAYQLRKYAKYMIAAETDMPGIGFEYSVFLQGLKDIDLEVPDFARRVFLSGGAKHKFMVRRANDILKEIKEHKYDNWDDDYHYVPEIHEKICKQIRSSSYQIAMMDLSKIDEFAQQLKTFVDSMVEYKKENLEDFEYSIRFAKDHSSCFASLFKEANGKKEYVDLNDFLMELYNRINDVDRLDILRDTVEKLYNVVVDKYYDG